MDTAYRYRNKKGKGKKKEKKAQTGSEVRAKMRERERKAVCVTKEAPFGLDVFCGADMMLFMPDVNHPTMSIPSLM